MPDSLDRFFILKRLLIAAAALMASVEQVLYILMLPHSFLKMPGCGG